MDDRTTDPPAGEQAPQPPVPRTGEDGKPVYDQEFFLALARCGKEVWNWWRVENCTIRVTFEGIDFRDSANAIVDFSEFNFGDGANFRACRFADKLDSGIADLCSAKFSGAIFGDFTKFSDANFTGGAEFSGSTFGDRADFSGASFEYPTNFTGAMFGEGANFFGVTFTSADLSQTIFEHHADFSGTIFHWVEFSEAQFGGLASFSGATFEFADFSNVVFDINDVYGSDSVDFSGAVFSERSNFSEATFRGTASFVARSALEWFRRRPFSLAGDDWPEERRNELEGKHEKLRQRIGLGPDEFGGISFSGARFDGVASFSGRMFKRRADLTSVAFNQPPDFDGCEGTSHIDFSGVKVRVFDQFRARLLRGPRIALAIPFVGFAVLAVNRLVSSQDFELSVRYITLQLLNSENFNFINIIVLIMIPPVLSSLALLGPSWTRDSTVVVRLRTLRTIAEEAKNHDLERNLYIEECRAELSITYGRLSMDFNTKPAWKRVSPNHRWVGALGAPFVMIMDTARMVAILYWIAVMDAYWLLADYGRSFVRPLFALTISVLLFWWTYTTVLIPPTDPAKLPDFRRAAWAFAISNAVPFVGALTLERDVKLTLLCGDRPIDAQHAQATGQPVCVPIPGRRFQLLALGQSIFSALCIFFAGLALRNYFKLR